MADRAHLARVAADPFQVPDGVLGLDVSLGGQHGGPFWCVTASVLSIQNVYVKSNRLYMNIMYS
jgi:hypothetical protein